MSHIYLLSQLQTLITQAPQQWRPLVLTNGCFDLLHLGHLRYLIEAKKCGKTLIVGLNSDRSVMTIKPQSKTGISRPIIPQEQRAELLSQLKPVDGVVLFSETTAENLIKELKPDVYVKGGDYTLDTLPETPTVQEYGGEIKFIAIDIPTSTTAIIEKILQGGRAILD